MHSIKVCDVEASIIQDMNIEISTPPYVVTASTLSDILGVHLHSGRNEVTFPWDTWDQRHTIIVNPIDGTVTPRIETAQIDGEKLSGNVWWFYENYAKPNGAIATALGIPYTIPYDFKVVELQDFLVAYPFGKRYVTVETARQRVEIVRRDLDKFDAYLQELE